MRTKRLRIFVEICFETEERRINYILDSNDKLFVFYATNMQQKKKFFSTLLLPIFIILGCTPQQSSNEGTEDQASDVQQPIPLDPLLEAHGGLNTWKQYQQVEYDLFVNGNLVDHQLIDLKTRKVLITSEQYTIGFDGQEVWITPDKEAYPGNSARFYHNLQFYFFAIPFVLADPGTHHEDLGQSTFQGETCHVVKTSFGNHVGDAPDDYYLTYADPETHQLKLLLYTVTYFSGEASETFNARMYDSLQEVDGLLVPARMISYRWENDTLGEKRSETAFRNVRFSKEAPDPSMFAIPEGAYIDKLE